MTEQTPKPPALDRRPAAPFLTDFDWHLLAEGRHYRTYEKLGAHPWEMNGEAGYHFAVWAPNAREVSVIGDWNGWRRGAHPLTRHPDTGVWYGFVPGVGNNRRYKYAIASAANAHYVEKADPHGFASELPDGTASRTWDLSGHAWGDAAWMATRAARQAPDAPVNIYEVHLGSWRRRPDGTWMTYREVAPLLASYVAEMGYTHVELMPITEHPFYGSWGYQTVGYFAPTARYGDPQDLMFLVDALHQAGVGVILDWVPAHFPRDEHGLAYFDGTHLYEHADPRQGLHTHWNTYIFNYGRREVNNFLISNALFWLDKYHIDGLRVDAVASMLYLDYGRNDGEWVPNTQGGRENLEAIDFLKRFNEQVQADFPGVVTIAEESTAWPHVTGSPGEGGLGFTYKWNMGWMHDMLEYMGQDPLFRPGSHNKLTFSMMYAYAERYVLAFSHDEVVHLKRSMAGKMPGDDWQKLASLRLLYGYMTGHPGKKLLFMGQEFGQWWEWNHDGQLAWDLLDRPAHLGVSHWTRDVNLLLKSNPALAVGDHQPWGFKWVDCHDAAQSVVSFMRYEAEAAETGVLFVCNFTPVPRHDYRVGVPWAGRWTEILNSDAPVYGGSGVGNQGGRDAEAVPAHGLEHSLSLSLPPLGVLILEAPPRPKAAQAEEKIEEKVEENAEAKAEAKPQGGSKPSTRAKSTKSAKPRR